MTLSMTLLCILAAVCILVMVLGISLTLFWWVRQLLSRLKTAGDTVVAFNKSVAKLAEIADPLSKVPEYMRGHAKAAAATAVQIDRLNQSVTAFSSMLIDPRAGKSSLTVDTEEKKDHFFAVQELLAGGMSLQEAETAAENEAMRRGSLPLGVE